MRKQMTDVERSIHEESEKIDSVKKIVRARSAVIENTQFSPEDLDDSEWKSKAFSNPNCSSRVSRLDSASDIVQRDNSRGRTAEAGAQRYPMDLAERNLELRLLPSG